MNLAVKLLLALLTALIVFQLGRMFLTGATVGGVTRRGDPMPTGQSRLRGRRSSRS